MINLQSDIQDILQSSNTRDKKISHLSTLFLGKKGLVFADFDDTISTNSCLFYSKIKFLLKYKTSDEQKVFDYLIKNFSLNSRFTALLAKKNIHHVVILSRNNHHFLEYFMKWFTRYYPSVDFSFVAAVWSTTNFILTTADKIAIIPSDALLISDMFEYKQLYHYDNFVSIDNYTPLRYYTTLSKKLVRFLFFVLSVVWKKF